MLSSEVALAVVKVYAGGCIGRTVTGQFQLFNTSQGQAGDVNGLSGASSSKSSSEQP